MPSALVTRGVRMFAAGDVAGATRLWLTARHDEGPSPELEACLSHVQAIEPALFARVAGELAAARGEAPSSWATLGEVLPPHAAERKPDAAQVRADPVLEATDAEPIALPSSRPRRPPPVAQASAPAAAPEIPTAPLADPWTASEDEAGAVLVRSTGPGLALLQGVAAPPTPQPVGAKDVAALEARLGEHLALDDFSGALAAADALLEAKPDHGPAKKARARCLERLEQMYRSKLGDATAVPRVLMSPDELIWLDLDHRSGFVLAQIDGVSSYEEIVELTGMQRLESYRILAKLVQERVIGV